MSYELIGNVEHIGQPETFGTSGGKKREFAINVPDAKYTKTIVFITFKDKCDTLDDLSVGDNVKVKFDITGKKAANGKYYNSLVAWNVTQEGRENAQNSPAKPRTDEKRPSAQAQQQTEDFDSTIPF